MESVMTIDRAMTGSEHAAQSRHQQMPLAFLKAGESANVLKVRGSVEMHHHLENLGFVAGAPLRVVSEQGGNMIIEIKGAQIALDRTAASKVVTC